MQYELVLKNEKSAYYQRISWIIILIHIIVFVFLAIFSTDTLIRGGTLTALLIILILFLFRQFLKNKKYSAAPDTFYLILMAGWIGMEQFWFAIIPGVFCILHLLAVRKLVVTVSDAEITYPSVPVKRYTWN